MRTNAPKPRWRDAPKRRVWAVVATTGAVLGVLLIAVQPRPLLNESSGPTPQATAVENAATSPTPVPEPSFVESSEVGPWSPARYRSDWPGAPRSEPASAPVLVELVRGDDAHWDPTEQRWEGVEHVDPVGDGVPGAPWLDIVEVRAGWGVAAFGIDLAAAMPKPLANPKEHWMAFGIMLDTNHDGRPDVRLGIDNMPSGEHRAWRTDFRLGVTAWKAGAPYGRLDEGLPSRISSDTWYPGEEGSLDHAGFRYYLEPGELQSTFYAWASVIEDGRVVGTDYAPDAGWLVFDDGDLALFGNHWDIQSATSPVGEASMPDSFVMRATFNTDGLLTIDACGSIQAVASADDTSIRLTGVVMEPRTPCPGGLLPIDQAVRAIVAAPVIEYTLDRGVLTLRAGAFSMRLIGTSEPL